MLKSPNGEWGKSNKLMCVLWDTDLSDKQHCMQCHTEPLMPFPIPSSHYGLTSADEIKTESLPKLDHFEAGKKPASILKGWCGTLNKNWETCDGQGKWLLKTSWNIPTQTCIFSWAGLDLRGNKKTCHLLIFSSNSYLLLIVLISAIMILYFIIVIHPICTRILFFFWYRAQGVYHSLSLQCYNYC